MDPGGRGVNKKGAEAPENFLSKGKLKPCVLPLRRSGSTGAASAA
ncbi:hypothetical protein SynSYN20_01626 [Synechococcus sp. SYN20]|nr:hypothetical protein SynSYN20_01626 [Synechococcus sp. SYN20]